MAKHTLEELRSEYNRLLQTCEIRADKLTEVQDICDTILANKPRYEAIATAASVPWFMVAAIHSLEGGLNFKTHLHNGDPLTARTVNEPAGRPKNGSPPFTFEESAIDALAFDKVAVNLEPTFAGICFKLEGFNGFRSRELGIHTPYLWSFSNHYTKGKFVKDGVFDPNAVSKQCGSAVILLRLLGMKAINRKQLSLGRVLKQSLQKAPKTKHEDQTMTLDTTIRAVQKELGVTVDGRPGPETWSAIHLSIVGKNPAPTASRGAIIRAVQKKLGVFEDGNPGPKTWAAISLDTTIRAVQKKVGITVDGRPGPETWGAIHLAVVGKNPAPDAGIDTTIRAVQKKLGVTVDGQPGPETWAAIHLAVVGKKTRGIKKARGIKKGKDTTSLVGEGKPADSRSEKNIATLLPRVRPFARALIEKAANQGIIIKVTSGTRSFAEQDELFKKHLAGGPLAAPPGKSNHNFGLAFDVTIFKGSTDPEKAKTPVFESPAYKAVGALGTDLGLEWGGNWKNVDEPHFQLRPAWAADLSESDMLAELRKRKDSGKNFFA
jgi:lysozyme family protein/peptidoglycan hydrolase-like protein with peptidoglycan-binding domain